MGSITILGLGPGDAALLTRQAWDLLQSARVLYLRTAIHPTVAELPKHLDLRPFDALYESAGAFGELYERIAAELAGRAEAGEEVLYAVPGHPLIAEATTRRLLELARERGIAARVVGGLSFVEPVCAALGLDPLEHGLQLLDALDLTTDPSTPRFLSVSKGRAGDRPFDAAVPERVEGQGRRPTTDVGDRFAQSSVLSPHSSELAWSEIQGIGPYTPPLLPYPLAAARPALICQVYNRRVASNVKLSLMERYPAEHPVTLVRAAGVAGAERIWTVPLHLLDHQDGLDHLTCAYLPALFPLADVRGPEGVSYIVARLLGPGGCPWDREQTHQSIRKDLLEETYEALEALDAGDMHALAEELGDVLLHVLMHSEMARQAGEFDLGDVYEHIATKLIRRHPHVFGSGEAWGLGLGAGSQASSLKPQLSSAEVLTNWDAIKREERAANRQAPRGLFDGIPAGLPALMAAQETIRKASKAGFDTADQAWPWNKLHEEIDELHRAAHAEPHADEAARAVRLEEEYGDLLLAAGKLGYRLKIDAESALRAATAKFRRRFAAVERLLREQGRDLLSIDVQEKESLWRQAKSEGQEAGD